MAVSIEGGVSRQVIDHQSQLGGLEQWCHQYRIDACLQVLGPRQRLNHEAVNLCLRLYAEAQRKYHCQDFLHFDGKDTKKIVSAEW